MENLAKAKQLRHVFTALLFASVLGGMNGCATVEGAGEDIQNAGEAVEEGAEEAAN